MSTWTYDVTTDIGKVRLMIGDTDIVPTSDAHFTDEEIQAMLTLYGSDLLLTASYLLEAWAAALSGSSGALKSEHIGDYSYTKDGVAEKTALALKYRNEATTNPAWDWGLFNMTDTEEDDDI